MKRETQKKLTVEIPKLLARDFKKKCIDKGITMREFVIGKLKDFTYKDENNFSGK